jgi:hypothetical protein
MNELSFTAYIVLILFQFDFEDIILDSCLLTVEPHANTANNRTSKFLKEASYQ